jgi:hypothetical protein
MVCKKCDGGCTCGEAHDAPAGNNVFLKIVFKPGVHLVVVVPGVVLGKLSVTREGVWQVVDAPPTQQRP